jgi:hypothetical protein
MAKRRRRRISLGLPAAEHMEKMQRAYAYAKTAQQHAYEASKCKSSLHYLTAAMMAASRAEAHLHSAIGAGKLGRQSTKLTDALGSLRKKLAKDLDGLMKNCVREYPE